MTSNILGNSKQRWENMLSEITNMEYMVVKCQSLIRKLFPNVDTLEPNASFIFISFININYIDLWK